MKKVLSFILMLTLCMALLAGCAGTKPEAANVQPQQATVGAAEAAEQAVVEVLTGGVLCLKINPEIALHYDAEGKIVKLEGRNEDGCKILENVADCAGKNVDLALEELVIAIGKAGYLVEEVNGEPQKIVLELDPGSCVPHEQFLQDMANCVKGCVERKCWISAEDVTAEATAATCPREDCPGGQDCQYGCPRTEGEKNGTPCGVCGNDNCDGGSGCNDANMHNYGHNNNHSSTDSGHNNSHNSTGSGHNNNHSSIGSGHNNSHNSTGSGHNNNHSSTGSGHNNNHNNGHHG